MAKLYDLNEKAWKRWLQGRPPLVREIAEKLPPNLLYRITKTGQRVTMLSYNEDGTVKVFVSARYNLTDFEREVFGVDPKNLEECDFPADGELVGSLINNPETLQRYIDAVRPKILAARRANPDDPHGKSKQ